MINPGVATTISSACGRPVDFAFISVEISPMFMNLTPIYDVVWGPHLGLLLELVAKPKPIYGLVQCMPKELPMDQFSNFRKHVKEEEQEHEWQHAF